MAREMEGTQRQRGREDRARRALHGGSWAGISWNAWKAGRIVRTMVSFGTPYRGSGNAVDFLCNGFVWKVGPVSAFDGTDALRSFDSIYQLLPIYPSSSRRHRLGPSHRGEPPAP